MTEKDLQEAYERGFKAGFKAGQEAKQEPRKSSAPKGWTEPGGTYHPPGCSCWTCDGP